MKRIELNLNSKLEFEKTSLAIGFFDGLHKGHRELLNAILKSEYTPAVLTFKTADIKGLNKFGGLLLNEEEKTEMLAALGVKIEYVLSFDKGTREASKEEFLNFLRRINAKEIVIGDDFSFAKGASGKATDLLILAEDGINVSIVKLKEEEGKKISSTRIRLALYNGNVLEANKLLSYPYFYQGRVVHGLKNGEKTTFKTANLNIDASKVKLKDGVYKTLTLVSGAVYKSMTNVGTHPTVDKLADDIVETHIIGFDEDIYGENIKVEFLERIRDQKQFNSLEELKRQLECDLKKCM